MKDFRNIIFVLVVVLFLLQMFVSKSDSKKQEVQGKPTVVLSTFALYDVASNISGDTLELVKILPFGVDAHSFEPTPKLMAKIDSSKLVVYSGAGLEAWIDGFNFKNKTVDMSKFVTLRQLETKGHTEHHHHGEHCNHKSSVDPHYWLDIENMKRITYKMSEEFSMILPKNKNLYEKNRDSYIRMLDKLENDYKSKLSSCNRDTIVVNHNAFSYIADKYKFHVESLSGFIPEAQPSPKDMIRVITSIKDNNISTIFFESFVSDKPIVSVAKEMDIKVDVLQPLGNITADEAKKGLGYEEIMRDNLDKFSKALKCQ